MSSWPMAMSAASRAVPAPTSSTTVSAVPEASKMVWVLATRKTPAVTMVAAWIRADTGVGPAMASGSQTYSGNWALLPVQARNSSRAMAVTVPAASAPASPKTTSKSRLPVVAKIRNMASRKPTSPMRLARKAFLAAGGAHTSWVSSGSPSTRRPQRVDDQQPPVEPEPDQQVRAEPDPLPAEEHDQEVLGQHQHQHRGHEQVEPGEEGLAPLVVLHVADRVQVDEAGDAGHDQGHERPTGGPSAGRRRPAGRPRRSTRSRAGSGCAPRRNATAARRRRPRRSRRRRRRPGWRSSRPGRAGAGRTAR